MAGFQLSPDLVSQLGGPMPPQQQPVPTTGRESDISSPAAMDLGAPQITAPPQAPPNLAQSQPQQPTLADQPNPYDQIVQQAQQRLQAFTPQQTGPPPTGVKRLLTNFFVGGGDAMLHHVGLPTPDEQRQNAEIALERAQQLRDRYSEVQQNLAAARQQQMQSALLFPQQLLHAQLSNQSEQQSIEQGKFALGQEQANAPTIQLPLDATTAKLAGVPNKYVGQNLNAGDWRMIDARLQAQGYQRFDTGQDGQGPGKGIWILDRGGNPIKQIGTVSESARATALVKMQLGAMKQPVYAVDPQTKETVLTTQQDAQARGMVNVRSVKETDISKDLHDTRVLNDIAAKANQVWQSASAMDDTGWAATTGVARYLSDHPNSTSDQLIQSGIMGALPQNSRNYIMDTLSLRESSMGMQKVLTGTARTNETQLQALLRTLPGVEPNSQTVRDKLQRFTQNVQLLRQGIPRMAGIDVVPISGSQGGGNFFAQFGGKPR